MDGTVPPSFIQGYLHQAQRKAAALNHEEATAGEPGAHPDCFRLAGKRPVGSCIFFNYTTRHPSEACNPNITSLIPGKRQIQMEFQAIN